MRGPKEEPHEKAQERIESTGTKVSGTSRREKDDAWSMGGGRQAQELKVDEEDFPAADPGDTEGNRLRRLADLGSEESE